MHGGARVLGLLPSILLTALVQLPRHWALGPRSSQRNSGKGTGLPAFLMIAQPDPGGPACPLGFLNMWETGTSFSPFPSCSPWKEIPTIAHT